MDGTGARGVDGGVVAAGGALLLASAPVPRAVARLGGQALLVAVAVFSVEYAHDGYSTTVLARRWADDAPGASAAAGDQRVATGPRPRRRPPARRS